MQKPARGRLKAPWTRARTAVRAAVPGRLRSGSRGQGMVEYALILMLVAMVVIVIFAVLGTHVSGMYSNVANGIK